MARNYKQPSIVSGLTVNDILNMDERTLNNLTMSDLRKITGRLVSAGNKRIRRLESADGNSPALSSVMKSGGAFSTVGKDKIALKAEFARARHFLNLKTSTATGWKKVRKNVLGDLKQKGISINDDDFGLIIDVYSQIRELKPESRTMGSPVIFKAIRNIIINSGTRDPHEITLMLVRELDKIYEQNAETTTTADVSSFFEI